MQGKDRTYLKDFMRFYTQIRYSLRELFHMWKPPLLLRNGHPGETRELQEQSSARRGENLAVLRDAISA
jgi:hypothetical protein